MTFHSRPYRIIVPGLVVEEVKAHLVDVLGVQVLIINLGDEHYVAVLGLDPADQPFEELPWNHLDHVAAEPVHTFAAPVAHDLVHPVPRPCVEITIVQPDGLVPVIHGGGGREAVARCLRRILIVGLSRERKSERLTGIVVEIILRPTLP